MGELLLLTIDALKKDVIGSGIQLIACKQLAA